MPFAIKSKPSTKRIPNNLSSWYIAHRADIQLINYGTWGSSPFTTLDNFADTIVSWATEHGIALNATFTAESKLWNWYAKDMLAQHGIDLFITPEKCNECAKMWILRQMQTWKAPEGYVPVSFSWTDMQMRLSKDPKFRNKR